MTETPFVQDAPHNFRPYHPVLINPLVEAVKEKDSDKLWDQVDEIAKYCLTCEPGYIVTITTEILLCLTQEGHRDTAILVCGGLTGAMMRLQEPNHEDQES